MGTEQIKTRLRALRTLMKANQINAYLVLSSDPHLSEYLPVHWQSRAWLSGFEGSAGTLLITEDKAALWTDSRYWSQAQDDLKGTGIQLMKQGDPTVIEPDAFLRAHLPSGSVLCLDYEVMPLALFQHWHNQAKESGWVIQKEDILLDILWVDRPSLPKAAVYDHSAQFAVRSRKEKLATIRQQMKKQKVQWHLISSLDDIAWLLNLRGADVNYNPVFLAHLLIGLEQAWLFIDLDKVPKAIKQALADDTVQVLEYEHLCRYLKELPEKNRLWFDPNAITAGTVENTKHLNWVQKANPSTQLKACKNKAEQDHIRQTMLQDGIALCEFYAWLEQTLLQ